MRKSILWFVFLTLLTIQSAFAQGFYVKGKVISQEDNEPLIGVSILQEGSGNGVVTDIDGNYSLEVKGTTKSTLVFSYIGMQSQKHEVSAKIRYAERSARLRCRINRRSSGSGVRNP